MRFATVDQDDFEPLEDLSDIKEFLDNLAESLRTRYIFAAIRLINDMQSESRRIAGLQRNRDQQDQRLAAEIICKAQESTQPKVVPLPAFHSKDIRAWLQQALMVLQGHPDEVWCAANH